MDRRSFITGVFVATATLGMMVAKAKSSPIPVNAYAHNPCKDIEYCVPPRLESKLSLEQMLNQSDYPEEDKAFIEEFINDLDKD